MNLLEFCRPNTMYNIDKPFSRGEWTYATDGVIIIRVPRVAGYDEDNGPKNLEEMFSEASGRDVTLWQQLPAFELKYSHCAWCDGKGMTVSCPEVGNPNGKCGFGEHIKCRKYNDDCQRPCKPGTEGAKPCEWCGGKGEVALNDGPIVNGSISSVKLNAIYLDKIKDLPGVQIAPHDFKLPFLIKFDGGEGLLMPMRMD